MLNHFHLSTVETSHTGRPIRYKLRRFGLPANQLTFTRGVANENSAEAATPQEITVADYFEQTYKIKLKYPQLPCIDGAHGPHKNAHWLPMEIVKVILIEFFSFVKINLIKTRYDRILGCGMATSD